MIINTFEGIVRFFFEKRNEMYQEYFEMSIGKEKRGRVQKALQGSQLCWTAGRAGVKLS